MEYNTISDSLSNSDWIQVTTTEASDPLDNGWYAVNWGDKATEAVRNPDKFYCPLLLRDLFQSEIKIPERMPECTLGMISLFAYEQQAALKRLFATVDDAKWTLTSFKTKSELERKLFRFVVKKMYSGELNDVTK